MNSLYAVLALCALVTEQSQTPLSSGSFLEKASSISVDYKSATEYFTVDKSGAGRAELLAAQDFQNAKRWSDTILSPNVAKELNKGGWTAYKDIKHRIEPIVATASINDSSAIWSSGDRAGALLIVDANVTTIDSAEAANDFALKHLMQYLKVPALSKEECKFYLKKNGDIWAGYINYGLVDQNTGKTKKVTEWYHSVLVITDGRNTIIRMTFLESGKFAEQRVQWGSPQVTVAKTKSRFDR